MEALGELVTAAQGLIGAGGWFANVAVALVGAFALLMKLRGIGREDQAGQQQIETGKQSGEFQQRLLKALERSDAREAALTERIDRLAESNEKLQEELSDARAEVGLVRNQLRNVTALLRQVRDGGVAPAQIELPADGAQ